MAGAVGPASSLRDAISRLISSGIEEQEDDPDWLPLFVEFWLQATREARARAIVSGSFQQCRELIGGILRIGQEAGIVRRDLDTEDAAALLIGTVDGIALQAAIDPRAIDLRRLQPALVDLIERFVKGEGAAGGIEEVQARTEEFVGRFLEPEGGIDS